MLRVTMPTTYYYYIKTIYYQDIGIINPFSHAEFCRIVLRIF